MCPCRHAGGAEPAGVAGGRPAAGALPGAAQQRGGPAQWVGPGAPGAALTVAPKVLKLLYRKIDSYKKMCLLKNFFCLPLGVEL